MRIALTTVVVLGSMFISPQPSVAQEKHHWKGYPHCNTWECVVHTRDIRVQRWKRCIRHSEKVGASFYSGSSGAYGRLDDGGVYFARLQSGGEWFNRFQPNSHWTVIYGNKSVRAEVGDWGSGGGDMFGYSRSVDMHTSLMNALDIHDNAVLRVTQNRCE